MALDVIDILNKIENFLNKNNTNTSIYDISNNLTNDRRVVRFYKGVSGLHEKKPVPKNQYPVVFIEADVQNEEFAQLGNACKNRNVNLNINIIPVTMLEAPNNASAADMEVIRIAQNIQALIRSNITLSSTVRDSNIETVEYALILREDTYNNVARMQIATNFYTD